MSSSLQPDMKDGRKGFGEGTGGGGGGRGGVLDLLA
jgi:hypothetical protein